MTLTKKVIIWSVLAAVVASLIYIPLIVFLTEASSSRIIMLSLIVLFGVIVLVTAVGLIFLAAFNREVHPIIEFSKSIAEGDLTKSLDVGREDMVGELMRAQNNMVEGLRVLVKRLRDSSGRVSNTSEELFRSSDEVMDSAEEVSSTIDQISRGAETQAQAVEETSEIISEIAMMAEDVAAQAKSTSETARAANEIARAGSDAAEETATKMSEIQHASAAATEIMVRLGERAQQIGLIVDVITNIAEKTNMLALNAAIEASRAGEHGRGFAVVAEEVRNLAEGSRQAADQIAKMIRDTEGEAERALAAMDNSRTIVNSSMEVINSTVEALHNIAEIVDEIANSAIDVAKATQAQKEGSQRVVKASQDIAAIAQEAAAGTQEAAAAASNQTASMQEIRASIQEVSRLAGGLQEMVERFKLSEEQEER